MLKLVRFQIDGHQLFENGTLFSIQATSQITQKTEERLIRINNKLQLNKTIGVVGVNASGKTTLLNIFYGLHEFYLNEKSIDQTPLDYALFSSNHQDITIIADIIDNNGKKYKVKTIFSKNENKKWIVKDEYIYISSLSSGTKRNFFDKKVKPKYQRNKLKKDELRLLSNKDSLFRVISQQDTPSFMFSTINITDNNEIKAFSDELPVELLQYLDQTIEYLKYHVEDEEIVDCQLKFEGNDNVIKSSSFDGLKRYLSSGTVRGITLFFYIIQALRVGATIIIDEIELHINKRIVQDFINMFTNPMINKNNATLIYSTHYIELIDELPRNDESYFITRNDKIKVHRLNEEKIRTELKKSELFIKNVIEGTAPSYSRKQKLFTNIAKHILRTKNFNIAKIKGKNNE